MNLFLDTNFLIHFKSFVGINWKESFTYDSLTLIISSQVIKELDKHKYSSTIEIARKAQSVLKKIEKLTLNQNPVQIASQIQLQILYQHPKDKTFKTYSLDIKDCDDIILASIIEYKKTVKDVSLLTNDVGPRLKAKSLGVNVYEPLSNWAVKIVKNPYLKELNSLKKENENLKARIPKLKLQFSNGENYIKFKKIKKHHLNPQAIEDEINKVKEKYPKIVHDEDNSHNQSIFDMKNQNLSKPLRHLDPFGVSKRQEIDYNEKLEQYYSDYTKYLHDLFISRVKRSLSYELEIEIANEGNVPAENIDVNLKFPDGFELIDSEDFNDEPEPPKPPTKPSGGFPFLTSILDYHIPTPHSPTEYLPTNVGKPNIKKGNSYLVEINVASVKHNQIEKFDHMTVAYSKEESIRSFEIKFLLQADNVPNEVSGILKVVFEE